MAAVTITDLNNAKLDVDHIADIATSLAFTATDRKGRSKLTMVGAINSIAAFTSRGNWAPTTLYALKDLVRFDSTWYACVEPHTSSASFATDVASKWVVHQAPEEQTPEVIVATQGQTVFDFLTLRYTPGNGSLHVHVNGYPQTFTENSDRRITFAEGLFAGDLVRGFRGVVANPASSTALLQTQIDAAQASFSTQVTSATNSATAAAASATLAQTAQTLATALANYKGLWSTLTGALAIPASVFHNGVFWALLSNLANVTTATPGVSASWTPILYPGGTLPDQTPRNRELGSAAYIDIQRFQSSSGAGFATGVTAGTPQSVTIEVPGIRAGDFVLGVSMSINMPANLRLAWAISADNTVRVTYMSDSGTVTPGAHTLFVRAERRFPE